MLGITKLHLHLPGAKQCFDQNGARLSQEHIGTGRGGKRHNCNKEKVRPPWKRLTVGASML